MVMYLGNAFPRPSCDLPKGSSEAGHLVPFYLVLLRVGFTEPPKSPSTLVSSYLTVSPLPGKQVLRAVYFLWHFPWDRSRWTLSSTLPYGVRTFLDALERAPRPSGSLHPQRPYGLQPVYVTYGEPANRGWAGIGGN